MNFHYTDHLKKLERPSLSEDIHSTFIRLDRNEAPFSAFDIVEGIINQSELKTLNKYPDLYSIYCTISNDIRLDVDQIVITHGSEQGIRYVFDSFLDYNDDIVYLDPSYAMLDVYAHLNKANVKKIFFDKSRHIHFDEILRSINNKTKLFVLANPNNPTGSCFKYEDIQKICAHTKKYNCIFLLDEAYFYYYEIESIKLLNKFDNLIITRSFSKAWGMAGARVGVLLSNKKIISLLWKQKPMHEINYMSLNLLEKIYPYKDLIIQSNVTQVNKWKKTFKKKNFKNLKYLETEGNFILMKSYDYKNHIKLLKENKILPKMNFDTPCLLDCFRFSVSNDFVMEKLISVLDS